MICWDLVTLLQLRYMHASGGSQWALRNCGFLVAMVGGSLTAWHALQLSALLTSHVHASDAVSSWQHM